MKVVVKILQGDECEVEVSPMETVLALKMKAKDLLGVDVPQQKLILLGKALADENQLSFYPGIKDGCRLNLVVKKEVQTSSKANSVKPELARAELFKLEVSRVLRQYYSETETDTILREMMKDLKKQVDSLSYDDLENLATMLIQGQEKSC